MSIADSSSVRAQSVASSSDLTRNSSVPSLSDGSSSSSVSSLGSPVLRPLEHLAVLLPRELWKPDRQAARCDAFACRTRFTLFERRHHCRKCGGCFCANCSSRSTLLLDTSSLDFVHPPRGMPLEAFASEQSPLLPHRVCDGCYNQLHGLPRTSLPVPAIATADEPSPLATVKPATRRPRRRSTMSSTGPRTPPPVELPPDLAELATYPLRHPSAICKATGGGRWVPAPPPEDPALKRMPGRPAAYEAALEAEAEARRRALQNPMVVDGAFRMRRPVDRAAVLAQLASSA
ncbi:unnamed protein product [Peniophora sp. CBMAI 1063]|nr:unnamed protein product [Peniophora sp. CBMAI 1063]